MGAFNSMTRYLDDLLNIDRNGQPNPSELKLNKANILDTEAPFSDLHLHYTFLWILFPQELIINVVTLIAIFSRKNRI